MEPVMNDVDSRKGNIVIGIMLMLVGLGIALERADVLHWSSQWSVWPLILGGIGLARFVQSPPGAPREGLIFMTAAAWILASNAGWMALEDSWPLLVIAVGLIIAFNGGRRWHVPAQPDEPGDPLHARRLHRHHGALTPLAVVGIWIAVFVGVHVSGVRSFDSMGFSESSTDRVRVGSVMGRSTHTSRALAFSGAEVTNVMGRSELDLREATLAPGTSAPVQVISMMGAVVLRVPPTWTVDTSAISVFGRVQDEREAPADPPDARAGPPPRLVLRGLVAMGRLTIR